MRKTLRKLLVPHPSNLYRPHAFRHKAVSLYAVGMLLTHLSFGVVFDSATVSAQVVNDLSKEIVGLTNAERSDYKLPALRENRTLDFAAQARLKDMFDKGYWDHVAPGGQEPWDFIKEAGYQYSYAGENLAKGFTEARATVNAWMESPTHRENLLSSNYDEIGVASGSGMLKGRKTTIIVQLFASPFTKGVRPVTVLGAHQELARMDLSNALSASNLPYAAAWLGILIMLLLDGWMLYKQGHHKDRHHRVHFGLAAILIAVLFGSLTIHVVNIL